jgi:hypothetical protein
MTDAVTPTDQDSAPQAPMAAIRTVLSQLHALRKFLRSILPYPITSFLILRVIFSEKVPKILHHYVFTVPLPIYMTSTS